MSRNKDSVIVCESPTTQAAIDNIGDCPFYLTASWNTKTKTLDIQVEVAPGLRNPYPTHRFTCDINPDQAVP